MSVTVHELPAWECFELLQSSGFGRLCVVDGGYPIAVPINYRVEEGTHAAPRLVVRTAPDTIVGRFSGPCGMEVDEVDLDHRRAWSVIVRGTLQPVHGAHDLPDPHPLVDTNRTRWLTFDVAAISGRRFTLVDADDGCSVEWQVV